MKKNLFMLKNLICVLTFRVLGHEPEFGESPKFNTKKECIKALEQKLQELKSKNKTVVGSCHQTTKQ
jgi:hypothetical protein